MIRARILGCGGRFRACSGDMFEMKHCWDSLTQCTR